MMAPNVIWDAASMGTKCRKLKLGRPLRADGAFVERDWRGSFQAPAASKEGKTVAPGPFVIGHRPCKNF